MLVLVLEMGGECGHGSEEDEVSELHEHHYEAVVLLYAYCTFLLVFTSFNQSQKDL